ncbi:hypothetical protein [Namhaeicola litoreus]|uniref:Sulfotransferase family protein n=1 Tax=Namhaeicola litoreus TaxID=1052145 RepID=A0ABW3Y5V4_9FLAO
MIISHKHKFIFIKTAKTAGTSIEVYLEKFCGDEDIITPIFPLVKGHQSQNFKNYFNPIKELKCSRFKSAKITFSNLWNEEKFYNHIPGYLVRSRINKNIWNNYFKFCVERNPWDKSVSHYHMLNFRNQQNLSFKEYISKGRFCLNYPKYTDPIGGKIILDKVILYENLNEGLTEVFNELGLPFDGFLNENAKTSYRMKNSNYQNYYDSRDMETIKHAFRKEIDLWNYSF